MIKSFLNIYDTLHQITPNFSNRELIDASHPEQDSTIIIYDKRVVEIAQYLRDELKTPLKVNSFYRSKMYNDSIRGAASNSQHIYGRAMDLSGNGILGFMIEAFESKNEHYKKMYEMGLRGIGFYDWGVHIDTRPQDRVSTWDYQKKKELIKTGFSLTLLIVFIFISKLLKWN